MGGFTTKDALALLRLIATLTAVTALLWFGFRLLLPALALSVSDVYVLSCVLLLISHLIHRHIGSNLPEKVDFDAINDLLRLVRNTHLRR